MGEPNLVLVDGLTNPYPQLGDKSTSMATDPFKGCI